jgi:hypothetical protein
MRRFLFVALVYVTVYFKFKILVFHLLVSVLVLTHCINS